MADRIKGITIEIGGDTTGLSKALSGVNSEIRNTQSQLKDVERLLKLDPSNTELLSQKQKLLAQAVSETKGKLETLQAANKQAAESAAKYDEWKEKYDPIKSKIDETKKKLSELKEQSKDADVQLANGEISKEKYDALQEGIKQTSGELKVLQTSAKEVSDEFGNPIAPEQYDALKREIVDTEQQLKNLESQAEKSKVALQKIGQAGEQVKEFGGEVTAAGKELSKLSAGVTAVGVASVAAWKSIDGAYDAIAKGTGATGKALEELQKSFDNVFSSIPTQADTAGVAIADINTRFGFTGEVLENCTRGFIQFAEVNNTDVSNAVAKVSRYMGDAGIESSKYGEVLDQLTAASQASGVSIDKLTENLTKYGAPMRALGLDTKESIAIFAGWEKAGVNTEIAFSGMKKAIGTWGKQGKDAREEFKSTLKEIERCPDIASATSKAIEVFGQKAGPDLADAIKGGRFAYEDFLAVLDNSTGQLERTFNDTLDPIDNVQMAIQAVTASGAELGGEILKTIAPMLTALAEKIKEAAEWFNELDEGQQKTVVTIGLFAAAIGPLIVLLGTVITSIGSIITAISGMGAVLGVLSAAGGPVILTLAAISGLVVVLDKMTSSTSRYKKEVRALTEHEVDNKTKVDELYDSYEQLNQHRNDSVLAVQSQAQHEQALLHELQGIADENGNVNAGYEERAAFIVGELSSALGTEISMTGTQIDNYKTLCDSVDQLILKKQANALLSANEAAYAEAIKNQTDAFMAYNDVQKSVEDTKYKLNEAQRQEARYQMELNALWAENAETGIDVTYAASEVADKMYKASEEATGYSEKLSELNQVLDGAESAYVGYNTTISNYEGLSAAIISGDQKKISDAVLITANDFKTAEIATKDTLQRQVDEFSRKYTEMQAAVNAGAPGVTQAQVDNMKTLVALSKKEMDKLPNEAGQSASATAKTLFGKNGEFNESGKSLGKYYSLGTRDGIKNGETDVMKAAEDVAESAVTATEKALKINLPSKVTTEIGGYFSSGLKEGITEGSPAVLESVDKLSGDMVITAQTELAKEYFSAMGRQIDAGLSEGILSGKSQVVSSILQLCKETIDTARSQLGIHSPSTEFAYIGQMSGEGFSEGWNSTVAGTLAAVETSMGAAVTKASETFAGIEGALLSLRDSSGNTVSGIVENAQQAHDALQGIQDSLEKTITGQIDMFSEFDGKSKLSTDELLSNMQSQVTGTEQWSDNLRLLAERGVDQGLLQKMAEMGPKGAGYVTTFTQMTDEELQKANALFVQSMVLPETVANNIMQSYQIAGAMTAQGFSGGIQENMASAEAAAGQMAGNAINAIRSLLEIHSPSKVTTEIGRFFTDGLVNGIEGGAEQVTGAVTKVASAATGTLSAALASSQLTIQAYQATTSTSWATWGSGLSASIDTTLTGINILTNSNMGTMEKTISSFLEKIGHKWEDEWKGISKNHQTASDELEKLNKQKMNQIKDDSLLAFKEMNDGIDTTLKVLLPIVQEGVDPAVKHITDLIPKSNAWGTDMMDGFIGGIKSKMRELERACEDAADTVSDYLHFTRPEKGPLRYYEEWMPHMMEGLSKGIKDNRDLLINQVKMLAEDMTNTMPLSGTEKKTVDLRNYTVLYLDDKIVADAINERLGVLL